jgi:hypothetical protein
MVKSPVEQWTVPNVNLLVIRKMVSVVENNHTDVKIVAANMLKILNPKHIPRKLNNFV